MEGAQKCCTIPAQRSGNIADNLLNQDIQTEAAVLLR